MTAKSASTPNEGGEGGGGRPGGSFGCLAAHEHHACLELGKATIRLFITKWWTLVSRNFCARRA